MQITCIRISTDKWRGTVPPISHEVSRIQSSITKTYARRHARPDRTPQGEAGAGPLDGRGLEGRGLKGRGLDGRGLDGRGLDGKGLDARGLGGKDFDGKGLDGRGLDGGARWGGGRTMLGGGGGRVSLTLLGGDRVPSLEGESLLCEPGLVGAEEASTLWEGDARLVVRGMLMLVAGLSRGGWASA
jgi:hypothetical protein